MGTTRVKQVVKKKASPTNGTQAKPERRPFWEDIVEMGMRIPDEELAKLPRDLSINIDHYLYGTPRVEE